MLGRFKFQGGFKNGELYAKAGETYIGGSPLAIDTDGKLVLATSGSANQYVGIACNSNTVDGVTASVDAKATYYSMPGVFTIAKETDVATYPFDDGQTYNESELLYIGATGLWTNQDPGSAVAKAIVLDASVSNELLIQLKA